MPGPVPSPVRIRPYREADFDLLVARWHETNLASFRYVAAQQRYTLEDARAFFRGRLLVECEVWVAETDSGMLAMIGLGPGWIRHLSVFPEHQRRGVGTMLLAKARERNPAGLSLYTFQRNAPARAFYEHHGFRAVEFGISPAPEREPDVLYRWDAGAAGLSDRATAS